MQPQIVREDSGSGLASPEGNDILLEEETSELPKSIPGRRDGLVDFMSNLDVSHVGARRSRIKNQGMVLRDFDKIYKDMIYLYGCSGFLFFHSKEIH